MPLDILKYTWFNMANVYIFCSCKISSFLRKRELLLHVESHFPVVLSKNFSYILKKALTCTTECLTKQKFGILQVKWVFLNTFNSYQHVDFNYLLTQDRLQSNVSGIQCCCLCFQLNCC